MLKRLLPYMKWIKLGAGIVIVAGAFFTGMKVEGWHKDVEISAIKLQIANDRGDVLKKSIDEMAAASKAMIDTAKAAQIVVKNNDEKLDKFAAEIKKFKPLPVDCAPDADRMHNLERAIDTANSASARR